jgi:pilus assembly protein Flp/PilA
MMIKPARTSSLVGIRSLTIQSSDGGDSICVSDDARNFSRLIHPALGSVKQVSRAETWTASQNQEAKLKRVLLKFLCDESGATAIEYGLIAAGISLAIIAVVNGLGSTLNTKFTSINDSLK